MYFYMKCVSALTFHDAFKGYILYLDSDYIIIDDMPPGGILDHSFRPDDGIVYLFSFGQPHSNKKQLKECVQNTFGDIFRKRLLY